MISAIVLVLFLSAVVVGSVVVFSLRHLIYVSGPNEALVFSGARRKIGNREVGFRLIRGGRGLRTPLFESVQRVDLTTFAIEVSVKNAYSRGGIPLNIVGAVNFKIAGDQPLIDNAIERFLGRDRNAIMGIVKETLEGNLRGVLAQLTPEEVNEDKTRFAQILIEEAEHDMNRMGLVLDTLKIQNVSDDVGYLNSIGRIRGAVVRKNAAIAEANAQSQAAVQKATNTMNANLAKIDADLEITRQQYKKRIVDAQSKRTAMIAEAQGQVLSAIAAAKAEADRQRARALQVERQLDAEVVQPAEAQRKAAEEQARGHAARILEQGRAQAEALKAMVEQYKKAGASAREMLALQKLLPLVVAISGAGQKTTIGKVSVLPAPGYNAGDNANDWARKAIAASEQIRVATGVDLAAMTRSLGMSVKKPNE